MANISDTNHFTIQGWMRTKLNLEGNDLLVFAIVYSFSQDGESEFRGSIDYIKDFIGKSRDTVMRSLKYLHGRHLVKRVDHNAEDGKTNGYIVALDTLAALLNSDMGGIANCDTPHSKLLHGGPQNATGGIANCDTINKSISKGISKGIEKERKKEHIKISIIEGVPNFAEMSDEELLDYSEKTGKLGIEEFDYFAWKALSAELKRRGQNRHQFKGKIVVDEHGHIKRLESYDEIMQGFELGDSVRRALFDFIRHCSINKRLVTNAKLTDIIMRLEEYSTDKEKIEALEEAINMGYFDIRLKYTGTDLLFAGGSD